MKNIQLTKDPLINPVFVSNVSALWELIDLPSKGLVIFLVALSSKKRSSVPPAVCSPPHVCWEPLYVQTRRLPELIPKSWKLTLSTFKRTNYGRDYLNKKLPCSLNWQIVKCISLYNFKFYHLIIEVLKKWQKMRA